LPRGVFQFYDDGKEYSLMSLIVREEYYRQIGKIPNLCDLIMVELYLGIHFRD